MDTGKTDVVLIFSGGGYALYKVRHIDRLDGVKFEVELFLHRPDDKKSLPVYERDAVRRRAYQYVGPTGYLGQQLVEQQQELVTFALKQIVKANLCAVM